MERRRKRSLRRAGATDAGARRPTMKQVAAVAGVSLATVSRVVNGGPASAPSSRRACSEAVELLGYRHNVTASTLRRADRLSASIGLIFEDVANPFFAAVHRGVEDVARERGVLTFAGSSDERPERERELAEAFSARRVDGLRDRPRRGATTATCSATARPASRSSSSTARRASSTPTSCSPTTPAAPRAPSTHLIAHGHRRIAFLGDRPERSTPPPSACAATATRSPATASARSSRSSRRRPRRLRASRARCCSPTTRRRRCFTSQNLITIDARPRPPRPRAAATRSRTSASTTSPSPTSIEPGAHGRRPGRRTRSGAARPSCSSRASTASPARRAASCTRRRSSRAARASSPPEVRHERGRPARRRSRPRTSSSSAARRSTTSSTTATRTSRATRAARPFNTARTIGRLGQPVAYLGPPVDRPLRHRARADARRRRRAPRRRRAHRRADHAGARRARRDRQRRATASTSAATSAPGLTPEVALAALPARGRDPARRDAGPDPRADGDRARGGRRGAQRQRARDGRPQRAARGSIGDADDLPPAPAARARPAATSSRSPRRTSPGSSPSAAPPRPRGCCSQAGPRVVLLTRGGDGVHGRDRRGRRAGRRAADRGRRHDRRRRRVRRRLPRVVALAGPRPRAARRRRTRVVEAARFGALVAARTCERAGASPPFLSELEPAASAAAATERPAVADDR